MFMYKTYRVGVLFNYSEGPYEGQVREFNTLNEARDYLKELKKQKLGRFWKNQRLFMDTLSTSRKIIEA